MPSNSSIFLSFFNKRILLSCFTAYIFVKIHHEYGYFFLYASHADYQAWFPKYHWFVYISTLAIKLAFAAFLMWGACKVLAWKNLANICTAKLRHNLQAAACYTLPRRHVKLFLWLQVFMLLLAVGIYYSIRVLGTHSFSWQVDLSRVYICLLFGTTMSFVYNHSPYFVWVIHRFLFSPSSAFNISVYRILFFALLAGIYYTTLQSNIPYIESKPREALPFIGWLIDILPISKSLYQSVTYTGIVCCCFIVAGLFTRFFVVINAVLVFYIIAVPNFYGKLWHSQLPIWISWFLLFAKLNGRFAIDNYIFPGTKSNSLSPDYTFPIRFIWLQIGIIYFWAGYHKLWTSGLDWALSQSMINQVRLEWFEHFNKLPAVRFDLYPSVLHIAGMATIIFELLYPFLLFHSRLKYISIAGGLIMHNLIDIMMYIGFGQLQYQYIVFVNYEKLFLAINRFVNKGAALPALPINQKINKPLLWFCIGLLSLNFIFGAFRISTFPFSAYPSYTDLVGRTKTHLHFEAVDADIDMQDIRKLAQDEHFRWESFSRIEYRICETYVKQQKTDTLQIQNVWKWWAAGIPQLADIDTVDIYAAEHSINPDSANIIISKQYLMRLYPSKQP